MERLILFGFTRIDLLAASFWRLFALGSANE
jgi:hypothetical protein